MIRLSVTAIAVGVVLPFTVALAAEATAPQSTTQVQTYGSRTECRADRDRGLHEEFQSECLAATGGLATRVADQLVIRARDGSLMGFADNRAACDHDDGSACKIVLLDSFDPARGFAVIKSEFYEGSNATFVDLARKLVVDFGALGDRFVVVDSNMMDPPEVDFAIYELDAAGLHRRLSYRADGFKPPRHETWYFGRWSDDDHIVLSVGSDNPVLKVPKQEVTVERRPNGKWVLKDWPR